MLDQGSYSIDNGTIEISSVPNSDFFISMESDYIKSNASLLYDTVDTDFSMTVFLQYDLKNVYDASGLMVYQDETHWIKLLVEMTDLGYTSIVSVIADGKADDCNGEQIYNNGIFLRINKKNNVIGLYYSIDGIDWKMHRLVYIQLQNDLKIGLEVQSPIGDSIKCKFRQYIIENKSITNMRKGI